MKSLGIPVSIEDVDRYELPLDNPRDAVVTLIKDVNQLELQVVEVEELKEFKNEVTTLDVDGEIDDIVYDFVKKHEGVELTEELAMSLAVEVATMIEKEIGYLK